MKDRNGNELTETQIITKVTIRIQTIIREFIVYILTLIGFIPSNNIRCFFYKIAGVKIGKNSVLHMGARFYNPKNIVIGYDSIIGEGIVLDGRAKLIIGNHVDIASEVMIYNSHHDIHDENFHPIEKDIVIEDYVFIGPRAIILPGVIIKKGAIVGAGAVVTKDIEVCTVVGGVPAKQIGIRNVKNFSYKLGRGAWFR